MNRSLPSTCGVCSIGCAWVIALVTWALAASQLTHVIAGSVEALFAVFSGLVPLSTYVGRYFFPVLLGNTLGGLVFVALLNHIQVASDDAKTRV